MKANKLVGCKEFPCIDVRHESYIIPNVDLNPQNVSLIMVSEAAPANRNDYYYSKGVSLFQQTTVQAFNDAGAHVSTIWDLVDIGVYFTTAVKCGKTGYGIKSSTIKECSLILENELSLFSDVKVFMLMGDVAIKAFNYIAMRAGVGRVIPVGSTYKIRKQEYFFQGKRVFPSYLQAGPSFYIEKSKRRMIAEDISNALNILK